MMARFVNDSKMGLAWTGSNLKIGYGDGTISIIPIFSVDEHPFASYFGCDQGTKGLNHRHIGLGPWLSN